MSHPAIPLPPVLPPADEGAFEQAIGVLERRLSAWMDAVRDVHALLQSGTGAAANDARDRAATPPAITNAATATVASPDTSRSAAAAATPAAKPATHDTKRSERAATGEPAKAATKGPAKGNAAVTVASAESATSDDEAALMASLDPQVAAQVRMLRRLGGNTRPLRELIDEVTAGETAPKEQKKSWWR